MLSLPHLVIIVLVALIVFGPEKLPELARTFGKVMAEFRRATGDLRAGFEEHMRELERETRISETAKQQANAAVKQPPAETATQAGTLPGPTPPVISATPGPEPSNATPNAEPENTILPPPAPSLQHATVDVTTAASAPEPPTTETVPEKASNGDA
ncbi:MAG: twin-arginine translocase TatA/TatE family subunit [Candidatus Acidiferrales bacterium]